MASDERNGVWHARGCLYAYIDALWDGRSNAPQQHHATFSERLATAAKMAALIGNQSHGDDIRSLVMSENGEFPREFLATDEGRAARSAFNKLSQSVMTLAQGPALSGVFPAGPKQLVGERLTSVTFILDYVQIGFDDAAALSVMCPIRVKSAAMMVNSGERSFRDQLCSAIGHPVDAVAVDEASLTISVSNIEIELMFAAMDAKASEAIIFSNSDNQLMVFMSPP